MDAQKLEIQKKKVDRLSAQVIHIQQSDVDISDDLLIRKYDELEAAKQELSTLHLEKINQITKSGHTQN